MGTLSSWSRKRRVIGKAEITVRGENLRFVVTSLDLDARLVYEEIYCPRGDMENRIKEQQLQRFATWTSGRLMRVNQVRLWLSSVAYVLLNELRRVCLAGTPPFSQLITYDLDLVSVISGSSAPG